MSFRRLLIHSLTINRSVGNGVFDEMNHEGQAFAPLATVAARVEVKDGRELSQLNEAGPVRGRYRIFLAPTDVTEADHLVRQDPPEVYEIAFVEPRDAMAPHHMELHAERVWP